MTENHWWMVREPMKGIEIAYLRSRLLAEDYIKWHAAGLVLNPDTYQIVEVTIEAEVSGFCFLIADPPNEIRNV